MSRPFFIAQKTGKDVKIMELMIIFLLLIVVAALLLGRNRQKPENSEELSTIPGILPEPQYALDRELEKRIAEFMEFDHFGLMIQPVVDFRTNAVCGGEVLSRLNHPERGVIFPDEFLPAVDAAGLYPRFDRYIFRKSCAWLSRSIAEGEGLETLSCNFSRKTLSEGNVASELAQIADSYGLPHNRIAIEITEREQETDAQQFQSNLKQLKADGFRIFLDDYGNGVTSVKDLMKYPLDIVKIDRSILLSAETEQGKTAYRALVVMAAELGTEVVCEGIETEEQNRFAREAGCHYGQGFLFFRPMSAEQVFEMIEKSSVARKWDEA